MLLDGWLSVPLVVAQLAANTARTKAAALFAFVIANLHLL